MYPEHILARKLIENRSRLLKRRSKEVNEENPMGSDELVELSIIQTNHVYDFLGWLANGKSQSVAMNLHDKIEELSEKLKSWEQNND